MTTTVTVNPVTFANALKSVLPHTGKDKILPVFRCVKVTIDPEGGFVTVLATDRYTMAEDKVPLVTVDPLEPASGETDTFLLDRDDVTRIIASLKSVKNVGVKPQAVLITEGKFLHIEWNFREDQVVIIPLRHLEFPKIGHIFEPSKDPSDVAFVVYGFNPDFLSRFKVLSTRGGEEKNRPIRMTFGSGPNKPVHITFGETFRAVVMPMRLAEGM